MNQYLDLAIRVLKHSKQKMTPFEIWTYACNTGFDVSFSKANSSVSSLSCELYRTIIRKKKYTHTIHASKNPTAYRYIGSDTTTAVTPKIRNDHHHLSMCKVTHHLAKGFLCASHIGKTENNKLNDELVFLDMRLDRHHTICPHIDVGDE